MSKKDYIITREDKWFKVEIFDENGFNTTVYEKDIIKASRFIIDWWENSKERLKSHELLEDAIYGCIKLDEELGLLKGDRDNLD